MWQRLQGTNGNVCILRTHDVSSDHVHAGSRHKKTSNAPARKTVPAKQPQPAPSKSKKPERATLAQRIEVLNWYHKNGKNQCDTARHFAPLYPNVPIKQPLVCSWVKDEAKWRTQWEQCCHESDRTAKRS